MKQLLGRNKFVSIFIQDKRFPDLNRVDDEGSKVAVELQAIHPHIPKLHYFGSNTSFRATDNINGLQTKLLVKVDHNGISLRIKVYAVGLLLGFLSQVHKSVENGIGVLGQMQFGKRIALRGSAAAGQMLRLSFHRFIHVVQSSI